MFGVFIDGWQSAGLGDAILTEQPLGFRLVTTAERCWSGRTGLPAKQLHPKRVSGVRIPPSPPVLSLYGPERSFTERSGEMVYALGPNGFSSGPRLSLQIEVPLGSYSPKNSFCGTADFRRRAEFRAFWLSQVSDSGKTIEGVFSPAIAKARLPRTRKLKLSNDCRPAKPSLPQKTWMHPFATARNRPHFSRTTPHKTYCKRTRRSSANRSIRDTGTSAIFSSSKSRAINCCRGTSREGSASVMAVNSHPGMCWRMRRAA